MSWVAVGVGGAALIGGGAGMYGASKMNKKRPDAVEFQPYSGYKPPRIDYTDESGKEIKNLRPVQQQITDILMQRSRGEDVGYDPTRRELMMKEYDLSNKGRLEDQRSDIVNALSGMGLSGNLAAYDEMYGRASRDADTSRDLYQTRTDIEDLSRANEERDANTARLQALNLSNFGQENKAADFDLSVYNAEQPNRYRSYGTEVERFNQYQEPISTGIGAGIEAGGTAAGALGGMGGGAGSVGGGASPVGSSWSPSDALAGTKLSKYGDAANQVGASGKYKYLLGGR